MNLLEPLRRRRRYLVSQLLGTLGVVWLGMVLQPCLMAAEMPMDGDCPHCPSPLAEDCGDAAATRCTYIDRLDYDGRHFSPKVGGQDFAKAPLAMAALPEEIEYGALPCSTGPPARHKPDRHTPPLNLLYCVDLN